MSRKGWIRVGGVAALGVVATLGLGAAGSPWRARDVAAAEQYREAERERAERYRRRVASGEARPARSRTETREPTQRRAAPERGWGRAREHAEHFRDDTLPSLRRWLEATAELVDDVVEPFEHRHEPERR